MSNSITHVSQSMDLSSTQLRVQVKDLQNQVEQMHAVLQYLVTSNFEINRDMEVIYTSLKDVAVSMTDPCDSLELPLITDPDDDLIN